jgi:hypothetical protein
VIALNRNYLCLGVYIDHSNSRGLYLFLYSRFAGEFQFQCADTILLTTMGQGSTSPTTTSVSPNTQPTATQANLSTPTSTTGGSNASGSGGGNNSLSTAALIGTIIASLTGAVGSCIGVWFGWKTYKNNKAKKEEEHSLVGNRAASAIELEKVKWRSETVPQD